MNKLKVALCQMLVREDKEENLKRADEMIRQGAGEGAKLIVLPEMFNCPYNNKDFSRFAEDFPGKTTDFLGGLARELSLYIVGGSIPERSEGKIYNTSYVFDPEGKVIGKHRKVHLFDIDVEGGIRFKESDTLGAGNKVTVVDTDFGKIGVAICYDMRFPEWMRLMTLEGARLIVVPAAFNMTTGPAHWDSLIKIRALDNQVFFIAASPARNREASYHAFGHSTIVTPWGDVVARADEKERLILGELDLTLIDKVRGELPLLAHRRQDLYAIKDLTK